jgi:hypothetical protein
MKNNLMHASYPPILRLLACVVLALSLTSCPETRVGADFGHGFAILKPEEWNGTWQILGEKNTCTLSVSDPSTGQITITEMPTVEKKEKKSEPIILRLRTSTVEKEGDEKLFFAAIQEKGGNQADLTPYLLRQNNEDILCLWMVDNDAVADGIKSGKLQGSIKENKDGLHCRLDSVPANYKACLEPQYWEWKQPIILVKKP